MYNISFFRRTVAISTALILITIQGGFAWPSLASPPVSVRPNVSSTTVTIYSKADDAELGNINCSNWTSCRNSQNSTYAWTQYMESTVQANFQYSKFHVKRTFYFFDTSSIPTTAHIDSATLNVRAGLYQGGSTKVHVVLSTANEPPKVADFGHIVFNSGGWATPGANSWFNIGLNSSALNWIVKGGTTKLALIHDLDLNNSTPNSANSITVEMSEYSQYHPYLVVTYSASSPSGNPVIVLVHGWHGLIVSNTNCSTGIVPYATGYATDFGMFPDALVHDGYDVYVAHLDTTLGSTPLIEANATCLAHQIADVRRYAGVANVILIAHSMGGVVSRAYMENANLYQHDVQQLITLGTPHTGTSYGTVGGLTFCLGDQAACEFTPLGMIFFNQTHSQRAYRVPYTFIGGTSNYGIPLFPFDGPNDGVIGLDSAMGRIYWAWRLRSPLTAWPDVASNNGSLVTRYMVHAGHPIAKWDLPSYFRRYSANDTGSTESYLCVQFVLRVRAEAANCPAPSANLVAQEQQVNMYSQSPSYSGHLTSAQVVTHTLLLDTSGASQLTLTWITGTVGLTLTNPLGTAIDPAYASANPSVVTYNSNTTDQNFPLLAQYTFSATVPGAYTLTITAGDVGPTGTDLRDFAVLDSPRTLTVSTNSLLYATSSTAIITASVQNNGVGLLGVAVQAQMHHPGIVTDTVTLIDRGGGTYTGTYTIPNVPGYLGLTVMASGNDAGTDFARQVDSLLAVSPATVQLNGHYSGNPQNPASDGQYASLSLGIGITATMAGSYLLSGDLVGAGSVFVVHGVISVTLSTGAITATLPFNGDDILRSGLNGPYTLTNLTITDQQYAGVPAVWLAPNVWTTAAYNHLNFGTLQKLFLPLMLRVP